MSQARRSSTARPGRRRSRRRRSSRAAHAHAGAEAGQPPAPGAQRDADAPASTGGDADARRRRPTPRRDADARTRRRRRRRPGHYPSRTGVDLSEWIVRSVLPHARGRPGRRSTPPTSARTITTSRSAAARTEYGKVDLAPGDTGLARARSSRPGPTRSTARCSATRSRACAPTSACAERQRAGDRVGEVELAASASAAAKPSSPSASRRSATIACTQASSSGWRIAAGRRAQRAGGADQQRAGARVALARGDRGQRLERLGQARALVEARARAASPRAAAPAPGRARRRPAAAARACAASS